MSAGVTQVDWLWTGQEVFPAMLAAIDATTQAVSLEAYIFAPGAIAERFRHALVAARHRGARVRVLVDAFGSYGMPDAFWTPLREAGGEVRLFNPLSLNRLGIRNHRKLLVCDSSVAFVGGFNIAPEYEGDGVHAGWLDLGVRVHGPVVPDLAASFDSMFARADFLHKRLSPILKSSSKRTVHRLSSQLLLSGPGRGRSPFKRALKRDLARAGSLQIMMAYFLPTGRLRRQIVRVAARGGQVQLLLAGKSDIAISRLAAHTLYRRLLRGGVQLFEYQPQVLHAKLVIVDDVVYVGSSNLDPRSLSINYELMLRFEDHALARQARDLFAKGLAHSRQVPAADYLHPPHLWERLKQHWAYFLLARIDPYLAGRQWRALPEYQERHEKH